MTFEPEITEGQQIDVSCPSFLVFQPFEYVANGSNAHLKLLQQPPRFGSPRVPAACLRWFGRRCPSSKLETGTRARQAAPWHDGLDSQGCRSSTALA